MVLLIPDFRYWTPHKCGDPLRPGTDLYLDGHRLSLGNRRSRMGGHQGRLACSMPARNPFCKFRREIHPLAISGSDLTGTVSSNLSETDALLAAQAVSGGIAEVDLGRIRPDIRDLHPFHRIDVIAR